MSEIFTLNTKEAPGQKFKLNEEFEKYATTQGLQRKGIDDVKERLTKYWNNYLDTGGNPDFVKKSIQGAIDREIGRARDDLVTASRALPEQIRTHLSSPSQAPRTNELKVAEKSPENQGTIQGVINTIRTRQAEINKI